MSVFVRTVIFVLAAGTAALAQNQPLLPGPADGPISTSSGRAIAGPLLPWEDNALADSLDQSGPPDGALFVARKSGGDSGIILLHYNFLYRGWWDRYSRSTNSGVSYEPFSVDSGFYVDGCLHGNGIDSTYSVSINYYGGGYHLYLRRSLDWGATWSDTIRIDRGTSTFTDKPMFTSRGRDLYVTYTDFSGGTHYIRMCYSHSWGDTWNTGNLNVSNSDGQGSCPAIGRGDTVYVVWGQPASWVPTSLWFNRSTDRGATWGTPRQIAPLDTSAHLSGWRANHTFPAMVVDSSGKIYVTVQEKLHGTGWDVAVYTSTNGGDSWSQPVMVNDDTIPGSDQFCSWIALDRHQRPHVFWYDSRNYYPTNSGDVYYSWSDDGGLAWQPNELVNDTSPAYTSASNSQMGDYQQIDCDTSYVYCEWSDHRNNRTSWSYIAAARRPLPEFVGVAEEGRPRRWQQSRVFIGAAAPNPVVDGTTVSFTLPVAGHVRLGVFDNAGRLVRTLLEADIAAGAHSARLDARSLPAGVYHCRLHSDGASATRPLVIAR
jgi:hypothetical protein